MGHSYFNHKSITRNNQGKEKSCNVRDNLAGGRSDSMKSDKISLKTMKSVSDLNNLLKYCVVLKII